MITPLHPYKEISTISSHTVNNQRILTYSTNLLNINMNILINKIIISNILPQMINIQPISQGNSQKIINKTKTLCLHPNFYTHQ